MRNLFETVNGLVENVEKLQKNRDGPIFVLETNTEIMPIVPIRTGYRDIMKILTLEIG